MFKQAKDYKETLWLPLSISSGAIKMELRLETADAADITIAEFGRDHLLHTFWGGEWPSAAVVWLSNAFDTCKMS